ncbi:MAG: hypothetical protein HC905_22895 [Bacteroidales bacterium]|nr:hypothetical protein [Bacteroidales bacterium]
MFPAFKASSQEITWSNAPQKGYVYQITNKEAKKILIKSTPDSVFKKFLHSRIDSFDVEKGWTNRPSQGHFILARAIGNKLQCEYTCVFPYQVFLMKEYDALSVQVLDLKGNIRDDAKVKLGFQRLSIDSESKTYRIQNDWFYGDKQIVTVELDGFLSAFDVTKNEVPWWSGNYNNDQGPSFYSYMITDKNKYKPNENVRFKSYALTGSRTPLRKELELFLTGNRKQIKLCNVSPHRPGSFTGEFKLHDSLNLVLDKVYQLQLREKGGRIVSNCSFRYEDYELSGNKLDIKLSKTRQFSPKTTK